MTDTIADVLRAAAEAARHAFPIREIVVTATAVDANGAPATVKDETRIRIHPDLWRAMIETVPTVRSESAFPSMMGLPVRFES